MRQFTRSKLRHCAQLHALRVGQLVVTARSSARTLNWRAVQLCAHCRGVRDIIAGAAECTAVLFVVDGLPLASEELARRDGVGPSGQLDAAREEAVGANFSTGGVVQGCPHANEYRRS